MVYDFLGFLGLNQWEKKGIRKWKVEFTLRSPFERKEKKINDEEIKKLTA